LVTWYPDNVLNLLNLMCNRLKGGIPAGIPTGIDKLPKLEVLELWNNSITGPLPPSLSASRNHCNGSICQSLCDSGNLTKLILFDKNFMCPIPVGLISPGARLWFVSAHAPKHAIQIPAPSTNPIRILKSKAFVLVVAPSSALNSSDRRR
jgi:hypothetical protein